MVRASRTLHRPWVHPPADRAAYIEFVHRSSSERQAGLLACTVDDGGIAGLFNLSEIVRGPFQSAYLGFYGSAVCAGKGLMTEGLGLLLDHAFRDLRLHRIEANIQPENERSIALVRRCGFRREGYSPRYLKIDGRWRDHERWAILPEDRQRRTTPRPKCLLDRQGLA